MGATVSNALVPGSVAAVAKQKQQPLAMTLIDVECWVLVDVSGSMEEQDTPGGQSRYQQACRELEQLQAQLPGKIGVIAFSSRAVFCANGVPEWMGAMTDLAGALRFAKQFDIAGSQMRFIVISDGLPDDASAALAVAKSYQNRIDVIYVGSELGATGRDFLRRLSQAANGQTVTAQRVIGMADEVRKLLSVR